MFLDLSQILGWVATILFSIMLIPQMRKTLKTENTEGVSFWLFVIYLVANIIALVYAFMIVQVPLIIKYEIGIMTTVFYITIYYIYSKRSKK